MKRVYNFSPGPCVLPQEVITSLADELPEFDDSGMSLIEMSHRGEHFTAIHEQTIALLRELTAVPDDFHILLLQGGATLQFAMAPMNLAIGDQPGAYITAGTWGNKAFTDAKKLGQAYQAWTGEPSGFTTMPTKGDLQLQPNTRFIHSATNETIHGVRFANFEDFGVPQVLDMSSEYLTRPIPWEHVDVVYGGAQKSLGPAGVCVVFVRDSVVEQAPDLPAYLSYANHVKGNSLANTPPVFSIWAMNKTLTWMKQQGGVAAMERRSVSRAAMLYAAIDQSDGFYSNPVDPTYRSLTNIVFRLPSEELEKAFVAQAAKEDLVNLKGHRSVGGIRASVYNALPDEAVTKLVDFMNNFAARDS